MALKIDVKFEGKMTCAFKNNMTNLEHDRKCKSWDLYGVFWSKVENVKVGTYMKSFGPK